MADKIRTEAFRRYEAGTIFLEADGPHEVVLRLDNQTRPGTFDYHLRKMTDDESAVLDVVRE